MIRVPLRLVALSVLACLALGPRPASAEPFLDLYLGAAFTQSADIKDSVSSPFVDLDLTFKNVDARTALTAGGRLGYWFDALPFLGLALDVFHFQPNAHSQTVTLATPAGELPFRLDDIDVSVTAISLDLMLRWPLLTSNEFPRGRLQPYLTVGPALFITEIEPTTNFLPSDQSDRDTAGGVKVGAGLAWQLHKNVALFGEYRFTHFKVHVEFHDFAPSLGLPPGVKESLSAPINTHHLLVGVSFRF